MYCFECATQDDAQRGAVAICTSCGAATCAPHSRLLTTLVSTSAGLGGAADEHTRTIVCAPCDLTLARHHLAARTGARG